MLSLLRISLLLEREVALLQELQRLRCKVRGWHVGARDGLVTRASIVLFLPG